MRKLVIWSVVLVCLTMLVSLGGTAERRRQGIEAAPTREPQPVAVTNFPAVQAVNGAVNVGNLPTVQTVAGSVQVSNLPLDADGNVRVASPAPTGRQTLFVQVANAVSVDVAKDLGVATYPVASWRSVQPYIRVNFPPTDPNINFCVSFLIDFGTEDIWVQQASTGQVCTYSPPYTITTSAAVTGPDLRLRVTDNGPPFASGITLDVWLFLSN